MVRALAALLVVVLTATLLAGCSGSGDKTPTVVVEPADAFTRLVSAKLGSNGISDIEDAQQLLKQFTTSFTYTQGDATLDTAGVMVATTTIDGLPQRAPLITYTPKTTLVKGDTVTIAGVSVTSDIQFLRGSEVVAQRVGAHPNWLTYGGIPLPIAADGGGLAQYTYTADGKLVLSFDRSSGDHPFDVVSDVAVDGGYSGNGIVKLAASGDASNLRLTADATANGQGHFKVTGKATGGSHEGPFGVDATATLESKGNVALGFGAAGLRSAGVGGSMRADGSVKVLEPGAKEYKEDANTTHPWVNANQPMLEAPLGAHAQQADPNVVKALTSLYGITLVPGDAIHISFKSSSSTKPTATQAGTPTYASSMTHAPASQGPASNSTGSDSHNATTGGSSGTTPAMTAHAIPVATRAPSSTPSATARVDYDLVVVSRVMRDVAGKSRPVLNLQGTVTANIESKGKTDSLKAMQFTTSADSASMLPISYESHQAQTYNRNDLSALLAGIAADDPTAVVPSSVTLEAKTNTHVAIDRFSPGLTVPAVGQAYTLAMPLLVAGGVFNGLAGDALGVPSDGGHTTVPNASESASVSLSSPAAGTISMALIVHGAHGPYSAQDIVLVMDSGTCVLDTGAATTATGAAANATRVDGKLGDNNGDHKWGEGEALVFKQDCGRSPEPLGSGSTHVVSLTLHGTTILDASRVIVR